MPANKYSFQNTRIRALSRRGESSFSFDWFSCCVSFFFCSHFCSSWFQDLKQTEREREREREREKKRYFTSVQIESQLPADYYSNIISVITVHRRNLKFCVTHRDEELLKSNCVLKGLTVYAHSCNRSVTIFDECDFKGWYRSDNVSTLLVPFTYMSFIHLKVLEQQISLYSNYIYTVTTETDIPEK